MKYLKRISHLISGGVHCEVFEALPINLYCIHTIDLSQMHPKVKEATFTLMCDVTNPLLGPNGATNCKVAYGVGRAAKKQGIPCVAIVGEMGRDASNIYEYGVESIMTTINAAIPIEQALEEAEELFLNAAERLLRLLRVGMLIK